MISDHKLDSLRKDRDNLYNAQNDIRADIVSLEGERDQELAKIHDRYKSKLNDLNRKLDEVTKKAPELEKQVRDYESKLEQEALKK